MRADIRMFEQSIQVWDRRGFVDSCSVISGTQVWSEGGGGFVHPTMGGHISPGQIRSRVVHEKEVRLTFEDGSRETVKLSGDMTFDRDDDVSLFYACPIDKDAGQLVGVGNHTEGRYWTLKPPEMLKYYPSAQVKLIGKISFWSFAVGGAALLLQIQGLLQIALLAGLCLFFAKRGRAKNEQKNHHQLMSESIEDEIRSSTERGGRLRSAPSANDASQRHAYA
jgi:hypothetical protein